MTPAQESVVRARTVPNILPGSLGPTLSGILVDPRRAGPGDLVAIGPFGKRAWSENSRRRAASGEISAMVLTGRDCPICERLCFHLDMQDTSCLPAAQRDILKRIAETLVFEIAMLEGYRALRVLPEKTTRPTLLFTPTGILVMPDGPSPRPFGVLVPPHDSAHDQRAAIAPLATIAARLHGLRAPRPRLVPPGGGASGPVSTAG